MDRIERRSLSRTLHDEHAARIQAEWAALLETAHSEDQVQDFLEQYPMLLPGATGDIGPGGHHGPLYGAVIRQAPLSGTQSNRVPDFMWITKASDIVTPICIEIETPAKRWFTNTGSQRAEFTQAQDQLADWRAWFKDADNERWFRRTYLPDKFQDLVLEPHFVLIIGRRAEFDSTDIATSSAERLSKRREWAREREHLRTFDSLQYDARLESEVSMTVHSNGQKTVHKIPATFSENSYAQGPFLLGDPVAAIDRSDSFTRNRRSSIADLWAKQTIEGERLATNRTHRPIPGLSPWGD
jgi:hypothetical protein